MVLIYVLMLACAAGLAVFIYRYDLHEKEPWHMAVLAVGMGFAFMWLAGMAEDLVLTRLSVRRDQFAAEAGGELLDPALGQRWWDRRYDFYHPPHYPTLPAMWGTIDAVAPYGRILDVYHGINMASFKHTHEYDDKYNVVGANFLNASDPIFNLTNPVAGKRVTAASEFFVLLSNGDLSPGDTLTVAGQARTLAHAEVFD